MIKNADLPAMPNDTDPQTFGLIHKSGDMALLLKHNTGLTKREDFAKAMMQGLLANTTLKPHIGLAGFDKNNLSLCAIALADALLAELERTKDD